MNLIARERGAGVGECPSQQRLLTNISQSILSFRKKSLPVFGDSMDVELNRRSFLAGMAGAFPNTSIGHDAHQATASMRPRGRSGDIDSNPILTSVLSAQALPAQSPRIPCPTGYKNGHS